MYREGITDKQRESIDIIVRNPEYLAQWLAIGSLGDIPDAQLPPYMREIRPLDFMTFPTEMDALSWLLICELGDGCTKNTISRYTACFTAYFCGDTPISDDIEARLGRKRAQVIRSVANALISDIGVRGVAVFSFPKKKAP